MSEEILPGMRAAKHFKLFAPLIKRMAQHFACQRAWRCNDKRDRHESLLSEAHAVNTESGGFSLPMGRHAPMLMRLQCKRGRSKTVFYTIPGEKTKEIDKRYLIVTQVSIERPAHRVDAPPGSHYENPD